MRNDAAKNQPKCVFIHPRKGIHCTMHALPGSEYCIRHKHLEMKSSEEVALSRQELKRLSVGLDLHERDFTPKLVKREAV